MIIFKRALFGDTSGLVNKTSSQFREEARNLIGHRKFDAMGKEERLKAIMDHKKGLLEKALEKDSLRQARRKVISQNQGLANALGKAGGKKAVNAAYKNGAFGEVAKLGDNVAKKEGNKAVGFLEKNGSRLKRLWGTKAGKAGIIGTAALGGLAAYKALRRRPQPMQQQPQYPQQ